MSNTPAPQDFWQPGGTQTDLSDTLRGVWNTFYLLGSPLPGSAWVTGQRHQKLDNQQPSSGDGANLAALGTEPATFNVRLELWTPAQWDAWRKLIPQIEARAGKTLLNALAVRHPALAAHRITAAYLKVIGLAEAIQGRPGIVQVTIQFYEWQPVRLKATGNVNNSRLAPKIAPGLTPTPLSPAESEAGP